jgi:hypothetical protein
MSSQKRERNFTAMENVNSRAGFCGCRQISVKGGENESEPIVRIARNQLGMESL